MNPIEEILKRLAHLERHVHEHGVVFVIIHPDKKIDYIIDTKEGWLELSEKLTEITLYDHVRLTKDYSMLVDDEGYMRERPYNDLATTLYLHVIQPGSYWEILGPVVIVKRKYLE